MYFLSFRISEQFALAMKNRVALILLYWIYFLHSGFLSNSRLPWKTEEALKIFTVLNIHFIIQDFWASSACTEKQSCPENFPCTEYTFYIQDFWATCACPEKQSCPGIVHCIENVFLIIQDFWAICACPEKQSCPEFTLLNIPLHSGFLSNLPLPWKTEGALKIFTELNIYFIIQDFLASSACTEKQSCPENFPCTEYTFYIQDFWVTCTCHEKQLPRNFSLYWNIFYYSGFLSNTHLPWKTELLWNFSLYWIYFLHSGFLSNLRLPWKRVALEFSTVFKYFFIIHDFWASSTCPENRLFPEIFQARVGWRPPDPRLVGLFKLRLPTNMTSKRISQADYFYTTSISRTTTHPQCWNLVHIEHPIITFFYPLWN